MLEFGFVLLVALMNGGAPDERPQIHGGNAMQGQERGAEDARPGCTPSGEVIRGVFQSSHGERVYRLYLPVSAEAGRPAPEGVPDAEVPRGRLGGGVTRPVPEDPCYTGGSEGANSRPALVVMLHGCTQDADDLARGTRMDDLAREQGVAVLYPEQAETAHPTRCWNWYEPAHQRRGAGEPALLAAMIGEMVARHELDSERVFVAGISAGGAMAVSLAATYPDLVTAAASHSGVPFGAARGIEEALAILAGTVESPAHDLPEALLEAMGDRARPIPLLVLHGERDEVVSARNAEWFGEQWSGFIAQVSGVPSVEELNPVRKGADRSSRVRAFRDASGRVIFEMWRFPGVGHAWSGGSGDGTYTDPDGPDASRIILNFFLGGSAS